MNFRFLSLRGCREIFRCISIVLFALALWAFGSGAYIYAKAGFAQVLIESAWQKTLRASGSLYKPWAWADTWPVARLQVFHRESLLHDLFVLAGSAGNSLSFGPGHLSSSALPGERSTIIVGGHRDTHFRHLNQLEAGDRIRLQGADGLWREYRFEESQVVDVGKGEVSVDRSSDQLLLVSCYPFNSFEPRGKLRWLGRALPEG